MTFDDTLELLALISSVDSRKYTDMSPGVWHEIIQDLPFDKARQAVIDHFRTPGSGYLTPQVIVERATYVAPKPFHPPVHEVLALTGPPADPANIAALKAELLPQLAAARTQFAASMADTFEKVEAAATADPHPFDDAPAAEVSGV